MQGSESQRASPELDPKTLAAELALRLIGRPADGSQPAAGLATLAPKQIVWVDAGDEVLLHLESIAVQIIANSLVVSVDLECDQTGRTPLVAAFALGTGSDAAGLVAVTDELPHGNGLLAARWGSQLQTAVWAAILGIAQDFAAQQNAAPRGIGAVDGLLHLEVGPPLQAAASSTATP
jgi:hypothetical protein